MSRLDTGQSSVMKPLQVLAVPGMYLVYKYNQYKRQRLEQKRRKYAEKELRALNHRIGKLLEMIDDQPREDVHRPDEECVVCMDAPALMTTFPCNHCVVCRRCFVKTIQAALCQRNLPLRCVVCRTKILKLNQTSRNSIDLSDAKSTYERHSCPGNTKRSSHGDRRHVNNTVSNSSRHWTNNYNSVYT